MITAPPIHRHAWFFPCLLLTLVVLVYANSFPAAFILDDLYIARDNPHFLEPNLITILRSDYWYGFENSGLYRPLTILSLLVNRWILGDGPLGFHLVNVLLHAGVTLLLWRVLLALQLDTAGARIAAILFAVHPLHIESVNVIVGRSELLVALLLLAGLLAARRDTLNARVAVACCFLLALLSKEHAIAFLVIVPLCDMFLARSYRVWLRRWPLYAALVAVAILWLLWREYGLVNPLPRSRITAAASPLATVDPVARVLSAIELQGLYLWKMLWGTNLQAVYSSSDLPEIIRAVISLRSVAVAVAAVVALWLCAWGWRRRVPVAFFALLYLVAFVPTANILLPIGVTFAERLAYFPSVWYCAAVGAGSAWLLRYSRWQRVIVVLMSGYALWLGGATLRRNPAYASELSLWSAEVRSNPADYLGWQSLAESYDSAGLSQEADAAYREMLALAPDYPGGLRSRTRFLLRMMRYEEALDTAMRVYAISRAGNDPADMSFDGLNVAEAYLGLGDYATALEYTEGTIVPQFRSQGRFLELRGKALANLGRDAEAVDDFARIAANAYNGELHYSYGQSLFRLGRLAEARQQLQLAVMSLNDAPSWNLFGVVCAELHDIPAALAAFERASVLDPGNEMYIGNLAKARRAAGR